MTRPQKKFGNNDGVTFMIDLSGALEDLATIDALIKSTKDPRYLDAIIDESFETADDAFNLLAEAAGRTGKIAHMYEWGTLGVNKGRSNMRQHPSSPTSRLWHTFNEGAGLDRTLWFAFRPSVANVPRPTVRDTGMSSDVIKSMRDHVFTWKSKVMENNEVVVIKPRNAKFLLIPAREDNRAYFSNYDKKRGYMMTKKTIEARPGATSAGKFTSFWTVFWEGVGADIMEENAIKLINSDYQPEFNARRSPGSMRPVGTMDVRKTLEKKSAVIQRRAMAKAKLRRTRNK